LCLLIQREMSSAYSAPAFGADSHLGPSLWRGPHRGVLGQGDASSSRPRRRPKRQPGPVAYRHDPALLGPPYPRVHGTADQGGPFQARGHPDPEALRRPGGLQVPSSRLDLRAADLAPLIPAVLGLACIRSAGPPLGTIAQNATTLGLVRACPHPRVAHDWFACCLCDRAQ